MVLDEIHAAAIVETLLAPTFELALYEVLVTNPILVDGLLGIVGVSW